MFPIRTVRTARCQRWNSGDRPARRPARSLDGRYGSARNQALLAEDLSDLLQGGVLGGEDEVGVLQTVDRQRRAYRSHALEQRIQCRTERLLVSGVDLRFECIVEFVQ